MNISINDIKHAIAATLWITTLLGIPSISGAGDFDEAERLYADHCAVCHGADRGGYIGPALNSDQTELTQAQVSAKIREGGATTLMPQHPTWPGKLSNKKMNLLASLIAQRPKPSMSWELSDIRNSLEVLVADESSLPSKPTYKIENLDDADVSPPEKKPRSCSSTAEPTKRLARFPQTLHHT